MPGGAGLSSQEDPGVDDSAGGELLTDRLADLVQLGHDIEGGLPCLVVFHQQIDTVCVLSSQLGTECTSERSEDVNSSPVVFAIFELFDRTKFACR
jgi:hypothetical protein